MSAQVTMNSHYCLHLTIIGDEEEEKMTYMMAPQAKKSVMTLSLVKDPSRKQRSSSSFHVKSCSLVTCQPIIYLTFAFAPHRSPSLSTTALWTWCSSLWHFSGECLPFQRCDVTSWLWQHLSAVKPVYNHLATACLGWIPQHMMCLMLFRFGLMSQCWVRSLGQEEMRPNCFQCPSALPFCLHYRIQPKS